MTSEQPPKDALRPLRPLPSIDVPLLREERSALRSRRFVRLVLGGAFLVTAAAVAGMGWLGEQAKPHASDASSEGTTDAPPAELAAPVGGPSGAPGPAAPLGAYPPPREERQSPTDPRAVSRVVHNFGKAISFREALEKNGLTKVESYAVVNALGSVMDFRRSLPEDTLAIERDAAGELVRFEYRSGLTQRYEVRRGDGGGLEARQIHLPIRHVRVEKGGTVTGSLGDALEGLKLGRSLAGAFSEVFDGQVNFSTDTRAGDTFRIIFDEEYVEETFLRVGTIHALEYNGGKSGRLAAFWHESEDVEGDFFDPNGRALHGGWLRTPLRYDHISSPYGMRFHPVLKRKRLHNGIDYAAGTGTPVRAAAAGVISFIGPKGPNGNLISIRHAQGFDTYYAHLSRFAPGLKRGSKVTQRQLIAYVGSTGRSTGPHLHFSLKKNGRFVDPASQLNGPGLPLPQKELPEFKRRVRELNSALERVTIERPVAVSTTDSAPAPTELDDGEDL